MKQSARVKRLERRIRDYDNIMKGANAPKPDSFHRPGSFKQK